MGELNSARLDSAWKLHIAAYYGNFRNFIEYYNDDLAIEYAVSLRKCLLNGCAQDENLTLFCYRNFYFRLKSEPEFIAICLTHGISISDIDWRMMDCILSRLGYIPETNLLKLIECSQNSDKVKEVCVYLILLNKYDLLDKIPDWKSYLNNFAVRRLVNTLNMTDLDFKKIELSQYPDIPAKSGIVHPNAIVDKNMFDGDTLTSHRTFNMRSSVIRRFLKYGEICEDDDAIMGKLSRAETLSIFYFYDPEYAYDLLAKEKPDLTFHKMIIPPHHWEKLRLIDEKYVDKALYSCIEGEYPLQPEDFDLLTHVNYDCLQLARSTCSASDLQFFKRVYERTRKCEVELNEDSFTPTKFNTTKFKRRRR